MKPLYASQRVEMRESDKPSVGQDVELGSSRAPVGSIHRHTHFRKQWALPRPREEGRPFNLAIYNRLEHRFLNLSTLTLLNIVEGPKYLFWKNMKKI